MVDLINEGLYTIKRLCDKMGPDGYYYFVQARKEEEEKRKGKRKHNMKRKRKWQKSVEKMGL